ncbi:hypothetical protein N657DRAFT_630932 [Parathielavia appendiculata]|uniref:Uncharacterized protein n=1 Tax=Parathielavia appendiculata TaxID=2587402 RepID=A0AAN6U5U7_9PEZI|nr:hypothetical protein N657DRAFT_630932 [Parathielavia appendiculata]
MVSKVVDFESAVETAMDAHYLSTHLTDHCFSQLFEAATELLLRQIQSQIETAPNPLYFCLSLRKHHSLQPWAGAISENRFIILVLILRAARPKFTVDIVGSNRPKTPREPFTIDQHCRLARAIHAFGLADAFNWHKAVELFG